MPLEATSICRFVGALCPFSFPTSTFWIPQAPTAYFFLSKMSIDRGPYQKHSIWVAKVSGLSANYFNIFDGSIWTVNWCGSTMVYVTLCWWFIVILVDLNWLMAYSPNFLAMWLVCAFAYSNCIWKPTLSCAIVCLVSHDYCHGLLGLSGCQCAIC